MVRWPAALCTQGAARSAERSFWAPRPELEAWQWVETEEQPVWPLWAASEQTVQSGRAQLEPPQSKAAEGAPEPRERQSQEILPVAELLAA